MKKSQMALLLLYSIVIQYPRGTGIPISHRQHWKTAISPALKLQSFFFLSTSSLLQDLECSVELLGYFSPVSHQLSLLLP
jgi:hypothetical protein